MKKLIAMLVVLCLLPAVLSGCAEDRTDDAPALYYLYKEPTFGPTGTIFGTEPLLSEGGEDDLIYLLTLYLSGPLSEELRSPFPPETQIEDVHQNGSILYLTMTGSFSQLSSTELTKASACTALTLFENTDARLLYLTVTDPDADMVRTLELTRDSLVLLDNCTTEP